MIVDVLDYGKEILKEGENLSSFCLGIIRIGNDFGCLRYQSAIKKLAQKFQLSLEIYESKMREEEDILFQIQKWNENPKITGIILLHPVPKNLNEQVLESSILPEKDVDGLASSLYLSSTVESILYVLKRLDLIGKNKKFAIIGRSHILGMPLYEVLNKNEQVLLFHREKLLSSLEEFDCVINTTGVTTIVENKNMKEESILFTLNTGKEASIFKGKQITTGSGLGYLSILFLFQHLQQSSNIF